MSLNTFYYLFFLSNIALRENAFETFAPIFLTITFKKGENRIKCLKFVYLCVSNYCVQLFLSDFFVWGEQFEIFKSYFPP